MKSKFRIGDKVTFDNKNVMTVIDFMENYYGNERHGIVCKYISKKGKIETTLFPEQSLSLFIEEQKNTIKSYPLLYCKDLDCYGFKVYSSLLANNFAENYFDENDKNLSEAETRFVYDLKKYGANISEITTYFDLLKAYFKTNSLIIVPAHGSEENNLQKKFGAIIKRITEVSPRKYNHRHPLEKDYSFSYQIDFAQLKDEKVILIDDIITSGETINHFAQALKAKGYEVIKFGIMFKPQINL
jgi:hypothetical protein